MLRKLLPAVAPLFISIYFLALTGRAVHTYFSPDDLLNLYQSWWHPAPLLIKANFLFFEPSLWPRPMASLWLRSIYSVAGFHPVPFKATELAILVANIFLTYAVARRLAGSRTAAALTALAAAYHGQAVHLYFDTGYVFDVLCYFFYFSAAIVYLRARRLARTSVRDEPFPTWRELAACCALFVCALNSKEIAITLPVFLLIYELLYHGPVTFTRTSRREKTLAAAVPAANVATATLIMTARRWAGVLATGAIALAVLAGRIVHGSLIQESAYQPVITWARFIDTSTAFAGRLFLSPRPFTPATLLSLWTAMLAIAWLWRSRALRFAWLFVMLSPLPIAFIDARGLAQYYIPLFGWALYAGVLLDLLFKRVLTWSLHRFRPANPVRTRTYASAALLAGLVLLVYPRWKSYLPDHPASVFLEAEENRSIARQLRHLEPHLQPGARLLFLDDPIRPDWFNLTFLVRLLYRDRSIVIHRAKPDVADAEKPPEALTSATLAAYDHVFDCRGGYFRELSSPWDRGSPMPAIVLEYGLPQIFHSDWTPVNRRRPARAGERVILKAMDLGETVPRLAPGQTFPQNPLAEVVAEIRALFNGAGTDVEAKGGWPGETNRYRVDIRVPVNAPHGLSWLDLSANGITGPAIEIPVR
jgi:hypothetical protein